MQLHTTTSHISLALLDWIVARNLLLTYFVIKSVNSAVPVIKENKSMLSHFVSIFGSKKSSPHVTNTDCRINSTAFEKLNCSKLKLLDFHENLEFPTSHFSVDPLTATSHADRH